MKEASARVQVNEPDEWILFFNRELDYAYENGLADEEWLAARYSELDVYADTEEDLYWLALARLAELTLLTAGASADRGDLRRVGDLMFNPRKILVHIRGGSLPVQKQRHVKMTEQFEKYAGGKDVISWLKKNTMNEIKEKPLAPAMMERLESGGRVTDDYLERLKHRAMKVADTVNLVSCCLAGPGEGFEENLAMHSREGRRWVESGLCRFDAAGFTELGKAVEAASLFPDYRSGYLKAWSPAVHPAESFQDR